MGFPYYYFLFLWNTFNDIKVLKCLVCEIVESLAPKGVMELVYIIKTIIVNCWSWVKVSFHFYIPKFLKVPVDKRNNTFQHLRGVISTYHRDSSWPPQFGFIRWTRKSGPPDALKNSPPHAPTDVQEGFPWTVFRNALLLVLKKTKATCSADHGARSAIFSLLWLQTAKGSNCYMFCECRPGGKALGLPCFVNSGATGVRRSGSRGHHHRQISPATRGPSGQLLISFVSACLGL